MMRRLIVIPITLATLAGCSHPSAEGCADAMVTTYRELVASGIDPLAVSGRSLPECRDLSTDAYTHARELTRNRLATGSP